MINIRDNIGGLFVKSNLRKLSFLLFGVVLMLAACGNSGSSSSDSKENDKNNASESSNADDKTFKIGITQIVEHPSLNAATEGFKKQLKNLA